MRGVATIADTEAVAGAAEVLVQGTTTIADSDSLSATGTVENGSSDITGTASITESAEQLGAAAAVDVAGAGVIADQAEQLGVSGGPVVELAAAQPVARATINQRTPGTVQRVDASGFFGRSRRRWVRR